MTQTNVIHMKIRNAFHNTPVCGPNGGQAKLVTNSWNNVTCKKCIQRKEAQR